MKHNILFASAFLLGGVLAFVPTASADEPRPGNDIEFLTKAAACGHAEVKYSELAKDQAESEKVKEFAQRMIEDHKKANNQLSEYARGLKTAVVAGLEKDKQDIYDRLSRLKGAEFDRAYMQQMIEDHEKAIQLFETQAKVGQHEGLKTFASETTPKLKKHLEHARAVLADLKK